MEKSKRNSSRLRALYAGVAVAASLTAAFNSSRARGDTLNWDPTISGGATPGGAGTWSQDQTIFNWFDTNPLVNSPAFWYNPGIQYGIQNGFGPPPDGEVGTLNNVPDVAQFIDPGTSSTYLVNINDLVDPNGSVNTIAAAGLVFADNSGSPTQGVYTIASDPASNGTTLTLGSFNTGVGTIDVMGSTNSATISANIVTGNGLTVNSTGSGTLVLSGNETITGGLNLGGGTVSLSGTNTITGTLTLGGGAVTLSGPNSISGGVAIVGGTLTLSNTNTITGGITLDAGALQITTAGALGSDPLTITTGTFSFNLPGGQSIGNAIHNNGAINATVAGTGASANTISGAIDGTGSLTVGGGGTLILTNTNTFSGNTTVTAGNIQLNNSLGLEKSTVNTVNGGLTFNTGLGSATLGGLTGSGNISLQDLSTGAIALSVGNNGTNPGIYSGSLSGSGSLTIVGGGTLTLTGVSNYTGSTTVTNGTLLLGNGSSTGALAGAGAINIGSSGILQTNNASALGTTYTNVATNGINIAAGGTLSSGGGQLLLNRDITSVGGTIASSGGSYEMRSTGGVTYNFTSTGGGTASTLSAQTGLFGGVNFNVTPGGGPVDLNVTGILADYNTSHHGAVNLSGGGVMALSGSTAYSGGTTVTNGTIITAAGLAGGQVTVNANSISHTLGTVSNAGISGMASMYYDYRFTGNVPQTGGGQDPNFLSYSALANDVGNTGPTLALNAPTINFQNNTGGFLAFGNYTGQGTNANQFESFYTGVLKVNASGTYTFNTSSDDGSVLFVNGQMVVNNNFNQGVTTRTGTIALTAGVPYSLQIAYYQGGGGYALESQIGLSGAPLGNFGMTDIGNSAPGNFSVASDIIVGSLSGNGNVNLSGGGNLLVTGVNSLSPTIFSGTISGTGGLQLLSAQSLTLSGANTFSGVTSVPNYASAGGQIILDNALALQNSVVAVGPGIVLDASVVSTTAWTFGGLSGSSNFTLQNSANTPITLTLNSASGSVATYGGALSGAAGTSLTMSGNGTQILTGNSSGFGGTTSITGGTLQIGDGTVASTGAALPGTITVGSAGTLAVNLYGPGAGTTFSNTIVNNGTVSGMASAGNTTLISSTITGSGVYSQSGATVLGTTVLNGSSTFSGMTVNNGTLALGDGTNGSISSPSLTLGAAGTLSVNLPNGGTFGANITTSAGGVINGVGASPNVSTLSGNITGGGALNQSGSGTTVISGNNSFSGNTTVTNGTLQVGSTNALSGSAVNITGGQITFSSGVSTATFNALSGAAPGTVNLTSTTGVNLTVGAGVNSPNTSSFSGTLTGNGSLTKAGTGTLFLGNSGNSYSGTTYIKSGTIQLGTPGLTEWLIANGTNNFDQTTPYSPSVNASSQSLQQVARWGATNNASNSQLDDSYSTNPSSPYQQLLWGNNTTWGYAGYLDNTTTSNVTYYFGFSFDDNASIKIDGVPAFTSQTWGTEGSLVLTPGVHTLDLRFGQGNGGAGPQGSGNGNFGGFGLAYNTTGFTSPWLQIGNDTPGTLFLAAGGGGGQQLPVGTPVVMSSATSLISGGSLNIGSLADASDVVGTSTAQLTVGSGTLTLGSDNSSPTFSGTITGGGLTKVGSGTQTLSGSNLYTGTTEVDGTGTLRFVNNAPLSSSALITGPTGTLEFNATSSVALGSAVATTITGSGTFLKTGSGTITLGGAHSVTLGMTGGLIDIEGGTVQNVSTVWTGNLAGLTVNNALFDMQAGGSVIVDALNGNGTIDQTVGAANQTLTVGVNGGTGNFTGTIANSSVGSTLNLVKNGSGTQTLGGANTFTGTTTINAGTLQLANSLALQNSTVTNNVNGGIAFTTGGSGHFTFGGLSGSGSFALQDNLTGPVNLTVGNGNSGTLSYTGAMSGPGSLTKAGSGTQFLGGSNTYGGKTYITGGTLQLGTPGLTEGLVANNNGFATGVPFSSWGAIIPTSVQPTARWGSTSQADNRSPVIDTFPAFADNTTWGYAGFLDNTSNTTLTYYFGKNFDDNAYLKIDNTVVFSDTGWNNNSIYSYSVTPGLHPMTVLFGEGGGGVGPNTGTQSPGYAGVPAFNHFGVAYTTNGAIADGNNDYNAGWLQLGPATSNTLFLAASAGGGQQIPNTTSVVMSTNTTFITGGGTITIGSLADDSLGETGAQIQLGGGTLTIGNDGTNTSFSGAISGAGSGLTKIGIGTQILTGSNTYSGPTTVNGGTLRFVDAAAPLASSALITGSPGILELNVNSGVTIGGTAPVTISGNGTFLKTGSGTLALGSNQVTFGMSGGLIDIEGGIVQDVNTSWTNNLAALTVNNATLDMQAGGSVVADALNGNGTIDQTVGGANQTLTVGANGGSGVFTGVIQNTSGTLSLIKTGSGVQALTNVNTYTGTTTINGGTLQIANSNAVASSVVVNNVNNGVTFTTAVNHTATFGGLSGTGNIALPSGANYVDLHVGSTVSAPNTAGYSGVLSGGGSLYKEGTGTQFLGGNNTYNGKTYVTAGTLQLATPGLTEGLVGGYEPSNNNWNTTPTTAWLNQTVVSLARWSRNTNADTGNPATSGPYNGNGNTPGAQWLTTNSPGGTDYVNTRFSDNTTWGYTGFIDVLTSGGVTYNFGGNMDDNVYLKVDGNPVITSTNWGAPQNNVHSLTLSQGLHAIDVRLAEGGGGVGGLGGQFRDSTGFPLGVAFNDVTGNTNNNNDYTQTYWNEFGTNDANTLFLAGGGALPTGTQVVMSDGATLIGGGGTMQIGSLTDASPTPIVSPAPGASQVQIAGTTLQTGSDNSSTTYSGTISGAGGSLVKTGSGTFILVGSNTYSGATAVNGTGDLQFVNSAPVNSPSLIAGSAMADSGATLEFAVTSGAGIGSAASTPITVSGYGTLLKSGGGTLTLGSGSQVTFAMSGGSNINITGGTVQDLNTSWTNNLSSLTVAGGALFDMQAGGSVVVDALNGSGTIDQTVGNANQTLTVGANGGSGVFTGIIQNSSGSLGLTKAGAGVQVLTNVNTYTGATNVVGGGTLQIGDGTALGASISTTAAISVGSGATLAIDLAGTLSNPETFANPLITNNGTVNAMTANAGINYSISSRIIGSGALNKNGPGTVNITGLNAYTGGTNVNGGALQVSGVGTIGSGRLTVAPGAIASLSQTAVQGLATQYWGGNVSPGTGDISYGALLAGVASLTPTYSMVSNQINYSGNYDGNGNLNKLTGNSTAVPVAFPGAYANNGGISFTGLYTGTLTIATGGTYSFNTSSDDGSALYIDGVDVVTGNWNNQGVNTRTFPITLSAGAHNIAVAYYEGGGGYAMEAQMNGPDTVGVAGNVNGWLDLGSGGTGTTNDVTVDFAVGSLATPAPHVGDVGYVAPNTASVVLNTQTLDVGADGTNAEFDGVISGSYGLVKVGAGVQTLGGSNTYTGNTLVVGGQLLLKNTNALAQSNVVGPFTNVANTGVGVAFDPAVAGHVSFGALAGSSPIVLQDTSGGAVNLSVDGAASNPSTTYSGVASGLGSLTKAGSGQLTLTGNNTFAGNLTVNGGKVWITAPTQSYGGATVIANGTLKISGAPGLIESLVTTNNGADGNGNLDTVALNPNPSPSTPNTVQLTPRWGASNQTGNNVYPNWGNNTTWGYSGFLDNSTNAPLTYLFGKNFDDGGYLKIDGTVLINDTNWNNDVPSSPIVLSPGLHSIDMRFGQGNGGVGPTDNSYARAGISYSTDGGTSWSAITDPGDGSVTLSGLGGQQIPSTSSVVMSNGTTFDTTAGTLTVGSLADGPGATVNSAQILLSTGSVANNDLYSGTLTIGNDNSPLQTFSGVISGMGGNLVKIGTGTQILQGSSTYTGTTTILGGILSTGASGSLTSGGPSSIGNTSNAASNLIISGGTLQYAVTGGGSTDRLFTIGTATATIDAASPVTFTNTGPLAFSTPNTNASLTLTDSVANVSTFWPSITDNTGGTTSVSKTGIGAWVLAGTNSYSGGTTVSGGTLLVGSPTALGNGTTGGPVAVYGTGSVLDLNHINTAIFGLSDGTVDSNGLVTSNAGSATLTINGSGQTYSGKIADGTTGQVSVVINSGTQTFGNFNGAGPFTTYTGGTEVKGGNATLVGIGLAATDGGSVYAFGGNATSGGDVLVDNGGNVISNVAGGTAFAPHANVTVNGTATFTNGTVDGSNINNTETIGQLNGSGNVVLYGNLYLAQFPVPTNLVINDGGSFSGNINEGTGTYDNVNQVYIPGSLPNSSTLGSVTFTGNSVAAGVSLANVLTLSGQSTYTGGTTVTGGTLLVSGAAAFNGVPAYISSATGLGPVTVQSTTPNTASHPTAGNSRLGGNATVSNEFTMVGNVTVASGGIISPGMNPNLSSVTGPTDLGILGTAGNETWSGGGTYVWKTNVVAGSNPPTVTNPWQTTAAGVAGLPTLNQDLLTVGGELTIDNTGGLFILDINHGADNAGYPFPSVSQFIIANATAGVQTLTGSPSSPTTTNNTVSTDITADFIVIDNGVQIAGDTVTVVPDAGGYDVQVNITPEPGSLGLLGLASLGLLRRRRARNAKPGVGCIA